MLLLNMNYFKSLFGYLTMIIRKFYVTLRPNMFITKDEKSSSVHKR